MIQWLLAIIVLATLVGVMMPARQAPAARIAPPPAADPWFTETSPTATILDEGSGEIRLTRRADGHFYADVDVNGARAEFMIDTGASGIALTEQDARRAGVQLDETPRSHVGEGAGGPLTGRRVTLDRVRLGSRGATTVDAVVIDGASTNLLGQSFLSEYEEVTVRGDQMILR